MSKQNFDITLGVVAISHNEEQDLPGFLRNLGPWVDEIVIVDDGSTDGTRKIAEKAKVNFLASPRKKGEYFADQRNKGIYIARSDWLIHMDIDERISVDLALEILKAICNPNYDAYHFRRLNYFLNRPMRGGDWTNWNLVHLARRECLRFSGMYHEKIELTVPKSRIGQLKNFMLHFNDESYAERLEKSALYQYESAKEIEKTHRSIGYFDILSSFLGEFIYQYVWKKGFMDGTIGLIWAFHAASANVRACILSWDKQNPISRKKLEEEVHKMWGRRNLEYVIRQKDKFQDGNETAHKTN